jgi:hypothetical protein
MPVAAELPVVAPVIIQVSVVTEQLSLKVGSGIAIDLLQPEVTFWLISAEHVIVGKILSETVTV